jgi:hypothetical protein
MVPFGLRIIEAELSLYSKNTDKCLIQLHNLLNKVEKIIDELKNDKSFCFFFVFFLFYFLFLIEFFGF